METTENQRIKFLISWLVQEGYATNQEALGRELGINSKSYLSQLVNGKVNNRDFINKLSKLDNRINRAWVVTGEGEMLNTTVVAVDKISTGKMIPFYDVEAAAGSEYGMNMQTVSKPVGMIEIGSILRDSESALRVYGNSMVPNYPAGCVVGLKEHIDSFIEPGTVFVIETADNRYIKRLYYNKDKSAFRCISDNTMKHDDGPMRGEFIYQEFEIPFSEVKRLFRVTGVIKRNIL